MNILVVAVVAVIVLVGLVALLIRRRAPHIERGIEEFHREMDALAPRHPSAGLTGSEASVTQEAPDVRVSRQSNDRGKPTDDQKPDSEA